MNSFVGLSFMPSSALEPLPVLEPVLNHMTAQIWGDRTHQIPEGHQSQVALSFTSSMINVNLVQVWMLDFFPSGKFLSSLCFSPQISKIIIIEQSLDYAMNKHSSKNQLTLVIAARA